MEINYKIGIIGLGYVGLPLAVSLSKKFETFGYDINNLRISSLKKGRDDTNEVTKEELRSSVNLSFTNKITDLKKCNFFIITVPTPVDTFNNPDLSPLISASEEVAKFCLKKNDVVVYESTVYPGATEEICVPILQNFSKLKLNKDFMVGYSPERINPGDKDRKLENIIKIVSGSNKKALSVIDKVYSSIIEAGTYKVNLIKEAEAAKVIENTQRDINIALFNELAILFRKMNLNSKNIFDAAATKWNFLRFYPGLVGGHCIGVDPYYLTHKATEFNFHPGLILAGRKINDFIPSHIFSEVINLFIKKKIPINANSKILILGATFKENCPDCRNSKVFDIVNLLTDVGFIVDIYDPLVKESFVLSGTKKYKIKKNPLKNNYDSLIICVNHDIFQDLGFLKIKTFAKKKAVIYDVKRSFNSRSIDGQL